MYKKREEFLLKRHKCLSEERDFEENALLERRFLCLNKENEKNNQKIKVKIYIYSKMNKMVKIAHYIGGYAYYDRMGNAIISYIRNPD